MPRARRIFHGMENNETRIFGDYERTAMETTNQFVSRHRYADFTRHMGGTPMNQNNVLGEGADIAGGSGISDSSSARKACRGKGLSNISGSIFLKIPTTLWMIYSMRFQVIQQDEVRENAVSW